MTREVMLKNWVLIHDQTIPMNRDGNWRIFAVTQPRACSSRPV
jgi:hypothetical protein